VHKRTSKNRDCVNPLPFEQLHHSRKAQSIGSTTALIKRLRSAELVDVGLPVVPCPFGLARAFFLIEAIAVEGDLYGRVSAHDAHLEP